jgi:hypothetical protein
VGRKRSAQRQNGAIDPKRAFTAGKTFYFAELFSLAAFYVRGK